MYSRPIRIVVIGGGSGTFVVLGALKQGPFDLTAVISMADDGGSTGILRDQYGVLPPGDVRQALIALAEDDIILQKLFHYRFENGDLKGHSFGNIFLSALEKMGGSFEQAVDEASRILHTRGEVLPVTLNNTRLSALLEDGTVVEGETHIDIPRDRALLPIRDVWLTPRATLNPRARKAIMSADMVVIGPGDLYTSIIPSLIVSGMKKTLAQSPAIKVYVGNPMTKASETAGYTASDFVDAIERYIGRGILDYALFNSQKPPAYICERYRRESAEFVDISTVPIHSKSPFYICADLLDHGVIVRHDKEKLYRTLSILLKSPIYQDEEETLATSSVLKNA